MPIWRGHTTERCRRCERIALRHAEVPRDDAQDVLDLDAARLDALHEIADDRLGDVERDRRAHVLPRRIEAGDGAFELAAAFRQPVGEQRRATSRESAKDGSVARFSARRFSSTFSRSS